MILKGRSGNVLEGGECLATTNEKGAESKLRQSKLS